MKGFVHPKITCLELDVHDLGSINTAVKEVLKAEGRIDIVVNNAGAMSIGPLMDQPPNAMVDAFKTNALGALQLTQAVFPAMAERRSGLIVNIGSIVGEIPAPWDGLYCASKAALLSLSQTLQMELRPFNIGVMYVAAGGVRSNIVKNQMPSLIVPGKENNSLYTDFASDVVERMEASQSKGAMGTSDFARVVVKKILMKKPKWYISEGKNSIMFKIVKALPRKLVLNQMWKGFSRRGTAAMTRRDSDDTVGGDVEEK
jgi:short-subunit dehydrogenase